MGGMGIVWLLVFAAIAIAGPVQDTPSLTMLAGLGIFQFMEQRIQVFQTPRGMAAAVGIKLLLCYLLIGYTGALNSSYFLILLLPVVGAATTMGAWATVAVTGLAMLSFLSFLFFLDFADLSRFIFDWKELFLRVVFLPVVGLSTFQLAQANRLEARKSQETAKELVRANEELVKAEAAVRRSERLAALGQLTAGLAHELRNPLGTIRASAEMLKKVTKDEAGIGREMTEYITSEVDRANSLVTRFLEFARPLPLKPALSDVHEVVDRAVQQYDRSADRPEVSVYKNYDPTVPRVSLDGEWMERVFYNLLRNAAEASPAGGSITVKTRPVEGFVEIAVIDRGSGITAEDRESIFNPFFTTKPNGVGLGLAIVSKIIDEHGGRIIVESEPGHGSVFRVLLPV
jgi:two-component system, NtrC family, sensor histidine kinase HydH